MPVRLLTDAERERLSGFPREVLTEDLHAFFTLTGRDRDTVPATSCTAAGRSTRMADRIDALVSEARELIEEISTDGRQAVAEAEAEADRNVARQTDSLTLRRMAVDGLTD